MSGKLMMENFIFSAAVRCLVFCPIKNMYTGRHIHAPTATVSPTGGCQWSRTETITQHPSLFSSSSPCSTASAGRRTMKYQ